MIKLLLCLRDGIITLTVDRFLLHLYFGIISLDNTPLAMSQVSLLAGLWLDISSLLTAIGRIRWIYGKLEQVMVNVIVTFGTLFINKS